MKIADGDATARPQREVVARESRAALDATRAAAAAAREAARRAASADGEFLPTRNPGLFAGGGVPVAAVPYSASEAIALADAGGGGGGLPPGQRGVLVEPRAGAAATADNWLRAMKAEIGLGDPRVFDRYVQTQGRGLHQLAQALDASQPSAQPALLYKGDLGSDVAALAAPALHWLQAQHPDASFRLLAVETPDSMLAPGQLAIEMRDGGGQPQQWMIDAPRDTVVSQMRSITAASEDSAWLERWHATFQASPEAQFVPEGDPAFAARYLIQSNYPGFVQSLETMSPADQTAFMSALAGTSLMPVTLDRDQVMVAVDATPLARGEVASVASFVDTAAVDDLATSSVVPAVGTDAADWRQTLDALAQDPPADVLSLKLEIVRLARGVTMDELDQLAASDPNALPAILNAVRPYPEVSFGDPLAIRFSGATAPAFDSMSLENGVVVVETSLDALLGAAATADLDTDYAVSDIPMTLRIPVPASASSFDWSQPSDEALSLVDAQLASIGEASLFLHGYQSTRGVWEGEMQAWMDQAQRPVIGIAMAGMGSEGDFLGNGDSMLTPRQYAFHTMEALDRLGLYSKDLNVIGHSMGGAAALEMGLATERLVAAGEQRPDVRYVLLEPAPSGDSVPFLTSTPGTSAAISIQNWAGTNVLAGLAHWLNGPIGGPIVDGLLPETPESIRDIHKGFAEGAGFAQLKATAAGLTGQPEPDPVEVQAFLARNPVLVVAGDQDVIVASPVVQGIFGSENVLVVRGDHYAHVEDASVLDAARQLFARPFAAEPPSGTGGGGGGRNNVR